MEDRARQSVAPRGRSAEGVGTAAVQFGGCFISLMPGPVGSGNVFWDWIYSSLKHVLRIDPRSGTVEEVLRQISNALIAAKRLSSEAIVDSSGTLHFFEFKRVVAEVNNDRMKAALKPSLQLFQTSLRRPNGRNAIPTVELFLEDLAADLPQTLEGLLFVVRFRQQVNGRIESQVLQSQMGARRIDPM